jgi:hypothetical protein
MQANFLLGFLGSSIRVLTWEINVVLRETDMGVPSEFRLDLELGDENVL